MTRSSCAVIVRLFAPLALCAVFSVNPAQAELVIDDPTRVLEEEEAPRLRDPLHTRALREAAKSLGTSATAETVWVGHVPGYTYDNYWSIWTSTNYGDGAVWDFEPPYDDVHGDTLQGWWPIRFQMAGTTGGLITPDRERPWRCLDYGNIANYSGPFGPGANGQKRTLGVTGLWHVDGGNTVVVPTSLDNTGDPVSGRGGVTWAPLVGGASAWMGLRRNGDTSYLDDPARGGTGNAFNETVLEFNTLGLAISLGGTDGRFPGYGSHMDQILYRDVDLSGPGDTTLAISFSYRTALATGVVTGNATRSGWFQHDPLVVVTGGTNPNFIESSGNPTPPADSFMVYVGAPAEGSVVLSDGQVHTIADPQRRWFGEVLRSNEGLYRQVLSAGGTTPGATAFSTTVGSSTLAPLVTAGGGRVRLVFRVKTNQTFDDQSATMAGSSSNGAGAAIVDDVRVGKGIGPLQTIGAFEAPAEIDNRVEVSALDAWKSTGKPPQPYFHPHALSDLEYQDLCGQPGNPARVCDMDGVVISMGDHDKGEATGSDDIAAEMEPWDGIVSPTIQLVGPYDGPGGVNRMGIRATDLPVPVQPIRDNYLLYFDFYGPTFDYLTTGQQWQVFMQSYPAGNTATGAGEYKRWGHPRYSNIYYYGSKICYTDYYSSTDGSMVRTTNASGIPDSLRFGFRRRQECYRFAVPTCLVSEVSMLDNMRLGLAKDIYSSEPMSVLPIDLYQDAFPFNDTPGIVGLPAAFDTTTALIKTGANTAFGSSFSNRYVVPGDSAVVTARGDAVRVDLVFRILPGPGNYMDASLGAESQLRAAPTAPVAIPTPGSGVANFWSNYLFDNGARGTPGGHPVAAGGALAGQRVWSPHVWNSARMDTTESQEFQLHKRFVVEPRFESYMTAYHEDELAHSHRRALAIPRNICFRPDTGSSFSTICGAGALPAGVVYPPAWAFVPGTGLAMAGNGDPLASPTQIQSCPGPAGSGLCRTIEGTKIIPDGLLTPGSHVQYFFRREDEGIPGFAMMPDTNVVYPQAMEGSLDGHRWLQFAILPDRWKSSSYVHPVLGTPGDGEACMLVVDWADRSGEERAWVETAEALGITDAGRRGSHNGWSSFGGTNANDPAGFVRPHIGQAGTRWDLYNVRGSGWSIIAGSLGNRLAFSDPGNFQINGKRSRQGPSLAMLQAYYRNIVLLAGGHFISILGPGEYTTSNDIGLLQSWLASGDVTSASRGIWTTGNSFVEEVVTPAYVFVSDQLGADLVDGSYIQASGDNSLVIDLLPTTSVSPLGDYHGLRNTCGSYGGNHDVLFESLPEAFPASYYATTGSHVASVLKPHSVERPWIALTDGWNLRDLGSPGTLSAAGRHAYVMNVLENVFGVVCPFDGSGVLDVNAGSAPRDFMTLFGNPMRGREAPIRFGLARAGRVEVCVYDVAGRLVKTLADRSFDAGEHTLVWDGTDAAGKRAASGVYFTKLRQEGGFEGVKKLVVLGR